MANPDPEIMPDEAKAVRPDAIIATGRSDYPNQVNNVLGFPFIFRGALDVQATAINEEMKSRRRHAIAELARERCRRKSRPPMARTTSSARDYIIPAPFDPRLMEVVSSAVAKAAMDSGVAQAPIEDFDAYAPSLKARLNPTTSVLTNTYEIAKAIPKRVVFAEAEEEVVLRAAIQFRDFGYGTPILVGRTKASLTRCRCWRSRIRQLRDPELAGQRHVPAMVDYPLQAPAAARLYRARRAPHGQSGAQRLRCAAGGAGPWRCDDFGPDPDLRADRARSELVLDAKPVRCPSAST